MDEHTLYSAKYADRILTHYIVMALENAGVSVNGDVRVELSNLIEDAVREAVNVAVETALERMRELQRQA